MKRTLRRSLPLAALLIVAVCSSASAVVVVESFAGPVAGEVVAGTLPQGGTDSGAGHFANITVQVANNSGPQTCIVFDSANPTGEDEDLGTPNETCGGPGQGAGGEVGMPGENCTPLGNVLIIAEDIVDGNADNIVDDPDDEAGGGMIAFLFDFPVDAQSITILDIDNETAAVTTSNDTMTVFVVGSDDLGDNSVQTLDLTGFTALPVTCIEVNFSSSGAVAEVAYDVPTTATESSSWGKVKGLFQ